ncbi:MAG: bifunctional nuclease family protein [Bacillota bacterium]
MIRLNLEGVGQVEETDSILLVLRAPEVNQLLVIETGLLEGQAVALEVEGVRAERPLTHDLLHAIIEGLGARIREVRIQDFYDETFFAQVVLTRAANGLATLEFDARPSDAVALAVRAGAPIYASEEVMEEAGITEEPAGRFAALFEDDPRGDRVIH